MMKLNLLKPATTHTVPKPYLVIHPEECDFYNPLATAYYETLARMKILSIYNTETKHNLTPKEVHYLINQKARTDFLKYNPHGE